jgi:hypothetical protein
MKNPFRKLSVFFLLLSSLLLAACGGGGGGSSPGTGTLGVSLTDAPACGFDAVNVTVTTVRVHQSSTANENDAGWSEITLNPARKVNLLDLNNGTLLSLGQVPLPAGHYTQVRLVLVANTGNTVANSVVLSGTTAEIAIDTPSAVQSGIKLINEFDVPAGQRVDLVLDFDACKSIVTRGNGTYALKPVIQVIPTVLNGIEGFMDPALLGSNVMVSAQQNGIVIRATSLNTATGEFFLARLPAPGNYDVVITANGRATAAIAAVPVTSTTSIVMVSTNAAPITLPASAAGTISGTVTLNPTSATEVASVAVKQTFASGPTITVKSQFVDMLGGYSLALPIGAPLIGPYGAGTLPITLNAQSAVAGKYTVEASALGYTTQSAAKDISAANAAQNFTLTP